MDISDGMLELAKFYLLGVVSGGSQYKDAITPVNSHYKDQGAHLLTTNTI